MSKQKGYSEAKNLKITNGCTFSSDLSSPKIDDDQISKLQNLNQILCIEIKSLRDENTILSENLTQLRSQIEAVNKMKEKSKKVEKEMRKDPAKKETEHEASISKAETQLQEAQQKIQEINAKSEATRKAWELEKGELLSQIAAARKEIEAITEELVRKNEQTRVGPMAKPWLNYAFQPLDMTALPGYPNKVPDRFNKWLPKFSGNNEITAEEHIDKFYNYMGAFNIEEEDVVMRLFALSLEGAALSWFRVLPDKGIKNWEQFHEFFIERWATWKCGSLLIRQFNEIKKKNAENVPEFNQRFDSLLKMIPNDYMPPQRVVLLQYLSAFDGDFGYLLLREKPTTLAQARDYAITIERDLLASKKIDIFSGP